MDPEPRPTRAESDEVMDDVHDSSLLLPQAPKMLDGAAVGGLTEGVRLADLAVEGRPSPRAPSSS
jgi:hypothetical protein